ncbi:hypothetical protein SAMN05216551_103361 [Chitinasiproducens palmae]|uniref:Uncharacterized protein n=1 Tax=Chitinasiproducens palmae TaxID=1770053 RepID=A0A1H2PPP6_9BURK|nr:hypothetical protein SAMN05216551_103361 [Chitinasiproducens palmae]
MRRVGRFAAEAAHDGWPAVLLHVRQEGEWPRVGAERTR